MAQQTLNNGDSGLDFRTKANENFTELYDRDVPEVRLNDIDEDYVGQIAGEDVRKIDGSMIKSQATAWVTFDGSQNPPTILESYNIDDVVKNNVGDYTIHFATPMDTVNYTFDGSYYNPSVGYSGSAIRVVNEINDTTRSINSIRIVTMFVNPSSSAKESFGTSVVFFGGRS